MLLQVAISFLPMADGRYLIMHGIRSNCQFLTGIEKQHETQVWFVTFVF